MNPSVARSVEVLENTTERDLFWKHIFSKVWYIKYNPKDAYEGCGSINTSTVL